jgi:hypothetical protein
MRAASPPVSFSLLGLSSATTGKESISLPHERTIRLASAYLLFTVVLIMVPKVDVAETLFDEANTPTNEIVVEKSASSCERRQPVTAFPPKILAQPQRITVRRIFSVYVDRLTNPRTFRELFCSLIC